MERPWRITGDRIRLAPGDFDVGGVNVNIVPCEIEGIAAFILRTDLNNAEGGAHSLRVIEIAATVRLRDALNLSDGDVVTIVVAARAGE